MGAEKKDGEGGRSLDLGSALNAISLSPNKSHAFVVGRDGKYSQNPFLCYVCLVIFERSCANNYCKLMLYTSPRTHPLTYPFVVLKIVSIRDGLRTTHNLRPGKTHMNYTGNDCAWNPLERMI